MNQDFNNEMEQSAENAGRTAGKVAGKGAKAVGKKAGRKAAQIGVKVAKAVGNVLLASLKAILPYIAIPLLIGAIALLSYFMIFEFIGTEKEYTKEYENKIIKGEDGVYYTSEDNMNNENKTIRDYYKYISGQSYSMSVGKSKEVFNPDDEEVKDIKDYYGREDDYNLAPNLLFALDEHLYNWTYKYSEQFIKPVNYDEDTFDLLPLIDEDGFVIVESEEEDEEGEKTGEMLMSVRDYGLGSILKYNEDESVEYERIESIKGEYEARDVWDGEKVVKEVFTDEFDVELEKKKIDLIDRVTLFTGNIRYKYEIKDVFYGGLETRVGTSINDKTTSYIYDVYEEKIYEDREVINPDTGEVSIEEVHVDSNFHDLLKYRNDDSAVFENLPVVVDTEIDNEDLEYLDSYLKNFEAYVPEDVITGFDFEERIDYDSHIFDNDNLLKDDYGFGLGSGTDKEKFANATKYYDIIQEYAYHFDLDPYVMLAIMTQESGGDPYINQYGIMQIYNGDRSETARNRYGEMETVKIRHSEKQENIDLSIKWASAYYRRILDMFDGDNYKAIQAYNSGEGTLRNVRDANLEAWNSGLNWLPYREIGRQKSYPGTQSVGSKDCMAFVGGVSTTGSIAADVCYLENTLQYYAGADMEEVDGIASGAWETLVGWGKSFMSFIIPREKDELIPKYDHSNHLSDSRIVDVLGTTKALDATILFSEATSGEELNSMNFWDDGFMETIGSIGLTLEELNSLAPNGEGYTPPIVMNGWRVSSAFGWRWHPLHQKDKFHNGIDIAAGRGTPVMAVADGVVSYKGFQGKNATDTTKGEGAGNLLKIMHDNGAESIYMHLDSFAPGLEEGMSVKQRDVVGAVGTTGGSTGYHLHYGFKINGNYVDPTAIVLGN